MVGSECPGSSGGKRVASLYVEELHAQPVGCPDSSGGRALVGSPEDLGLISGLGL